LDDKALYLASLGPGVTSTNTGGKVSSEMKTKSRLLCSSLLVSLIIVLPAAVPLQTASVARHGKADQLIDQLRDLDLMQRNVEECYRAESGAPVVEHVCTLSRRNPETLDGALVNRVFWYLAGTSEYERFVTAHRALIQLPDHRRLHADKLFAEYMCLLESGRMRFLDQLNECQGSLAEDGWAQAQGGLAQSIQAKTVKFGHVQGSERPESGRAVSRRDGCTYTCP
jgi:hypothetical protein